MLQEKYLCYLTIADHKTIVKNRRVFYDSGRIVLNELRNPERIDDWMFDQGGRYDYATESQAFFEICIGRQSRRGWIIRSRLSHGV